MTIIERPARAHLVHQGGRDEYCFFLLKGTLARQVCIERGGRQIVALYLPGDVCGLSSLTEERSAHNVIALSPVSYLPISRSRLASCMRESPDVLEAVWREIARETAISAAWTANIGQRRAYRRVAHFICELEARWRAAGHDTDSGFDWSTQSDFGAATGLSLVHTNKTLQKLKTDHLASLSRRLCVHDKPRLRAVAGFDPAYLALERENMGFVLVRTDAFEAARKTYEPFLKRIAAEPATASA